MGKAVHRYLCPLRSNYTEREVILPTIGAISAEKPEVVILMNHIPLTAWLRHQSKVLIDSLEISKMCCCVEDLKRFIVNLPCCLGRGVVTIDVIIIFDCKIIILYNV